MTLPKNDYNQYKREGFSAAGMRERPSHKKIADNKPHGNSNDAERSKIKLYRIGFETRRFPWEIGL